MSGMHFHQPADDPGQQTDRANRTTEFKLRLVLRASSANICLCHCLVLTLFLSPLALGFAIAFAETEGSWLRAHYHYLRTSIAVLVIGLASGSLMILAGVTLSSVLMLAGLSVCAATLLLVTARSLNGFCRAFLGLELRNHNSYFL